MVFSVFSKSTAVSGLLQSGIQVLNISEHVYGTSDYCSSQKQS